MNNVIGTVCGGDFTPVLPPSCSCVVFTMQGGHANVCSKTQKAYGAFVDFAFAIYPTSLVYNLKIGKRLKLGISSLMAAGVFSGVCAVVKTVEVERVVAKDDATCKVFPLSIIRPSLS